MIRRAKTKFKPVVKKPAGGSPLAVKDVHASSSKQNQVEKPGDSPQTQLSNLKATDDRVVNSPGIYPAPDLMLTNEKQASSTLSESHETSSKPRAAVSSRRRKLVAQPQTTRKKPKVTEETNEIEITRIENIESGVEIANAVDEEQMKGNLDTADQKSCPEPKIEKPQVGVAQEKNLTEESHSADRTALTAIAIVRSPPRTGSEATETVLSSPQSVTTTPVVVELSTGPKKPIKSESKIHKHRQHAMQKLNMLKKNSDKDEWPEIDHNVLSMSDLIFINPPVNVGLPLGMNATKGVSGEEVSGREAEKVAESSNTETAEQSQDEEESSLPVPQIRVAEDGTVVIDEDSLVLDTQKPVDPNMKTVYEDSRDLRVTQTSFLRRPHAKSIKWSKNDTDKFYRCLGIVGAEFSLMRAMFRTRSADDLRRKYRRERKTNPGRVDNALKIQHLSKWTEDMFQLSEETDGENVTDSIPKVI